jgi:hypothetical protein
VFFVGNWRLLVWLNMNLGGLTSIREESSMSVSAKSTVPQTVNQPMQAKFEAKLSELAELISIQEYGPDGPPKELTFREIERVGYQAAQRIAAKFETTATAQHQQHFEGDQACPQCGDQCEAQGLAERRLLTRLGPVNLSEIKFHCNACRRSFFPST